MNDHYITRVEQEYGLRIAETLKKELRVPEADSPVMSLAKVLVTTHQCRVSGDTPFNSKPPPMEFDASVRRLPF